MTSLRALERFIDELLQVAAKTDEPAGIWIDSDKEIRRFGLALEPAPDLGEWIAENRLDAIFLHRPWRLDAQELLAETGVLAYHKDFDKLLSVGYNSHLANDLNLRAVRAFESKDDFPLGMIGDCAPQTWNEFLATIESQFGGVEAISELHNAEIKRIAVVGAMTDELIRKAFAAKADVYLSGQMRVPARDAIAETKIGVVATGHKRAELWGLRKLAALLEREFSETEVIVYQK